MRPLLFWLTLPLAAQTAIVDSHTSCLLGGWHRQKWVDGKSLAPFLKGDREYQVFGSSGTAAAVTGTAPKPIEGPCGGAMEVSFGRELPQNSVAVTGAATLRVPESLPLTAKAYVSAFRELLTEKGIRTAVHIDQLVRVDLDGD